MIKTTNERGQETYKEVDLSSPFSADLLQEEGYRINEFEFNQCYLWVLKTNLGDIWVQDIRSEGGSKHTESGYKSSEDEFWITEPYCDLRTSGVNTFEEVINWIKDNSVINYKRTTKHA